jgi:hypothetical protein
MLFEPSTWNELTMKGIQFVSLLRPSLYLGKHRTHFDEVSYSDIRTTGCRPSEIHAWWAPRSWYDVSEEHTASIFGMEDQADQEERGRDYSLLVRLTIVKWRWRQHASPKRQRTSIKIQSVTSQKTVLLAATSVRNSQILHNYCFSYKHTSRQKPVVRRNV